MQYILTQEELDALKAEQRARLYGSKKDLQKLATLAARHIPVKPNWAPRTSDPSPWGCALDGPEHKNMGYCDCCPAQIICPSDSKSYSK